MAKLKITPELSKAYRELASARFSEYKTAREDNIDPKCKTADAMYTCMINRALESTERERGTDSSADPRAQTGSTLFYRATNQFAAIMARIINSEGLPFKYIPISNEAVSHSKEESYSMTKQYESVAKWVWRKDKMKERIYSLASQLGKYGNVPVQMIWKEVKKRVVVGSVDGKPKYKEVTEVYPSCRVLPWDAFYGDFTGGNIQEGQDLVIIKTQRSLPDLLAESHLYDPAAWEAFIEDRDSYRTSGTDTDAKEDRAENRDQEFQPTGFEQYNFFDVYGYVPIENGIWDEAKNIPKLVWMSCIGDTFGNSIAVRMVTDFDPNGCVPILMLHAVPDDEDRLYHLMPSEIGRSLYSTHCTLTNLALDNSANINDPKRMINTNYFVSQSMDDDVWLSTDNDKAVKEFIPPDTSGSTVNMLQEVERQFMLAFDLDKNMMGQAHGGRTAASEALNIRNQSAAATLSRIAYILEQLLPWYGQNIKSYIEAYAPDDMVIAISDEKQKFQRIRVRDLHGDFDIETNIVGEYESNEVNTQRLTDFLRAVGQSPALVQSRTHQVDIGELVKGVARGMKVPNSDRIVLPPQGGDARERQRDELYIMKTQEVGIAPLPTDDHYMHIDTIKAELTQYAGREEEEPWIEALALPHMAMHQTMMEQADQLQAQQTAVSENGGTLPSPSTAETDGQVVGEEIAGALGGGVG